MSPVAITKVYNIYMYIYVYICIYVYVYVYVYVYMYIYIVYIQVVLGPMLERKSGQIVVISSIAGKLGVPTRAIYSASKFGLSGYFDALRAEIEDMGVDIV